MKYRKLFLSLVLFVICSYGLVYKIKQIDEHDELLYEHLMGNNQTVGEVTYPLSLQKREQVAKLIVYSGEEGRRFTSVKSEGSHLQYEKVDGNKGVVEQLEKMQVAMQEDVGEPTQKVRYLQSNNGKKITNQTSNNLFQIYVKFL